MTFIEFHWHYWLVKYVLCSCPVHCRVLSRIPGYYPTDSSTSSHPVWQPKVSPDIAVCPSVKEAGDKITPGRETTMLDDRHLVQMFSVAFLGLPVSFCQITHHTYPLCVTYCPFFPMPPRSFVPKPPEGRNTPWILWIVSPQWLILPYPREQFFIQEVLLRWF